MPIKPIDLQTLFAQLSQVGKQQAAEKDGATLHVNLHNSQVKRIADEAAKAVHRAKDDQTETSSIKEDAGSGFSGQPNEKKDEENKTPDKSVETISDPALGGYVDISG